MLWDAYRMDRDDYACVRGFQCWSGLAGLWYARKRLTSPPVVLRAESLGDLREKIDQWHADHLGLTYRYEPAPQTY